MSEFSARFITRTLAQKTITSWSVTATIFDILGVHYAQDVIDGASVYVYSAELQKYLVTNIAAASSAGLTCDLVWVGKGLPKPPAINGLAYIGSLGGYKSQGLGAELNTALAATPVYENVTVIGGLDGGSPVSNYVVGQNLDCGNPMTNYISQQKIDAGGP